MSKPWAYILWSFPVAVVVFMAVGVLYSIVSFWMHGGNKGSVFLIVFMGGLVIYDIFPTVWKYPPWKLK